MCELIYLLQLNRFPSETSGDSRCNANPLITPMYTLFLRSHNRLAATIRARKPTWTDERIFRQARRLNTLVYKRLVFTEWLPIVVGIDMAAGITAAGAPTPAAPPTAAVSNEWATAAARFYWSMMPGTLPLVTEDADASTTAPSTSDASNEIVRPPAVLDMQHEFYRTRDLSQNNTLDRIMSSVLGQRAQAMDTFYVDDVSWIASVT